jgi:NhaP-type Na+/H+ or K+/H+ antiporter
MAGAKVFIGCAVVLFAVVVKGVTTAHLGVGVDVNGNQIFVVHGQSPEWFYFPTSLG